MLRIAAHLRFKGNCREAFSFYQKCLGGKLDLMTVGDSPMAKDMPDMKDKIMHAWLKNDGIELMGADLCKPGQDYDLGNAVSLGLIGGTAAEFNTLFDKLSKGGKVGQAPQKMFFGMYADLVDKFGVEWLLQSNEGADMKM